MQPRAAARLLGLLSAGVFAACSGGAPTAPTEATSGAVALAGSSPPPATAQAEASVASVASVAPSPASAAPTATASAAPVAEAASPTPRVKVENIGMHIGGGPNDAATKEPIKKSVAPHFDALKRCFAQVEDAKKGGDFGVDLTIDAGGGKPLKLTHVKTTLKGEGFRSCMVSVFEQIDFLKPKKGKTTVSYSVRFSPES